MNIKASNEIAAELSALRFIVEILLARDFAQFASEEARLGGDNIKRLTRVIELSEDGEDVQEIARSMSVSVSRLVDRADEMRGPNR